MEAQTKQIKQYLEAGHSLTPIEALDKFKCFRLAARISDLKQAGFKVDKQMVQLSNGKRVACYEKA